MFGLLILSLIIQLYGGSGTITTSSICWYRTYFTMRAIIELAKLVMVVVFFTSSYILWQKVIIDDKYSIQYIEFIAFAALSLGFTVLTTIWSTLRIYDAH